MSHEICRGDRILIKLSNFSFVPPQGSELDASFLETKSDSTYSKYVAAFDQIKFQLTLTYIDFLPVPNFQRQIVSIPSENSLRLPPVGVPNNDTSHFSIAFAQGAASNIISEAYPFTITQPAVRILSFFHEIRVGRHAIRPFSELRPPRPRQCRLRRCCRRFILKDLVSSGKECDDG